MYERKVKLIAVNDQVITRKTEESDDLPEGMADSPETWQIIMRTVRSILSATGIVQILHFSILVILINFGEKSPSKMSVTCRSDTGLTEHLSIMFFFSLLVDVSADSALSQGQSTSVK